MERRIQKLAMSVWKVVGGKSSGGLERKTGVGLHEEGFAVD